MTKVSFLTTLPRILPLTSQARAEGIEAAERRPHRLGSWPSHATHHRAFAFFRRAYETAICQGAKYPASPISNVIITSIQSQSKALLRVSKHDSWVHSTLHSLYIPCTPLSCNIIQRFASFNASIHTEEPPAPITTPLTAVLATTLSLQWRRAWLWVGQKVAALAHIPLSKGSFGRVTYQHNWTYCFCSKMHQDSCPHGAIPSEKLLWRGTCF